jgi:hypothetical protein
MTTWWVLMFLLTLAGYGEAWATDVPNGALRIAYRQSEGGKLSEAVFHLSLWCQDDACSARTLSLNQCAFGVFYPKIEGSINLRVLAVSPGMLILEERNPEVTFKYEFRYTTWENPDLSRSVGLRGTTWFENVVGFSGAAVKYSVELQKVISWDLVPLKGRSPRVKAACDILLDGVPE